MHYYHINAYACSGQCFKAIQANEHEVPPGSLVLEFHSSYLESSFFQMIGNDYFVFSGLKKKLENEDYHDLSFEKISKLLYPDDAMETFSNLDENSFWKVNIPSEGPINYFYLWKGIYLVVSQKALDFLMAHNAFKDMIGGSPYGKEFEVLINRYFIIGDVNDYFLNKFDTERKIVERKMKMARDEGRRLRGLPPIE